MPTSCPTLVVPHWCRRSMDYLQIISNARASKRRRPWRDRAPPQCCCPAVSTRCARRACHLSRRLAMGMACTLFRLTPEEALRGVTVNAAGALGLRDRGTLTPGQRADVAVWNAHNPAELAYWIGGGLASRVFAGGTEVSL